MITHLRNKALKDLGISFVLLILSVIIFILGHAGVPEVLVVIGGIFSVTFAFVFYIRGNIALAEAMGQQGAIVAAIIILASLCFGWLFFVMPLILIFGLEDRNRVRTRKRSHHSEHAPAKRNPSPELPPLRSNAEGKDRAGAG